MVSLLADDTSYIIYVQPRHERKSIFLLSEKKNVKNQNKLFQV